MKKASKTKHNLADEINGVAAQINDILNLKQKDRYFEGIAILHSFIEDLMKWLVFTQIVWNKTQKEIQIQPGEVEDIRAFCNQSTFFSLFNVGLSADLVDYKLYQRLNEIRKERNSLVHQYWLYVHKGKKHIIRKKLEKIARTANELVGKFNSIIKETSMNSSFFEVSTGKKFIVL
jgi:hypothetical protein